MTVSIDEMAAAWRRREAGFDSDPTTHPAVIGHAQAFQLDGNVVRASAGVVH